MLKGFVFESAPFRECHASTIVELSDGRLLASWFGGTREGARDVAIWLSAFDGGRWSEPRIVAREPGVPCWNPVLFRVGDIVYLFYKAGENPRSWSGFYVVSKDGGETWERPTLLPAGILGPVKNKPLVLDDGTVLCGTSVESYNTWACWVDVSRGDFASWEKRGPIFVPGELYGVIQPALIPLGSRHICMFMRATRRIGRICRADSKDGGLTWSAARPTDLPNPNAGIDAVRLRDGRIVLVHNPTTTGRTPLVVSVSADLGASWQQRVVLEDEPGEFSYPSVIEGADGRIHIVYTWRRRRIAYAVLEANDL